MKDFSVLVDLDALEVLPKSGNQRRAVLEFIQALKDYAVIEPDYELTDSSNGRFLYVNIVAGFNVVWWVDGADKEVKIVDIEVEV